MAVTVMFLLGMLCVQGAWLLVVPPFGGLDEFDHANYASAVGHGQLINPGTPASDGRGVLVRGEASVADASRIVCESYDYTERDNCTPVERDGDRVLIASASGIYPPTYYAMVGWATNLVGGTPALYLMRLISMFLCAVAATAACWIMAGRSRSGWQIASLVACMTPTAVYTSVVAAPNGLEIFAALLMWTVLVALDPPEGRHRSALIATVVATACLVAWLRPLGPIWLFVILTGWIVLVGPRHLAKLVRRSPWQMSLGIGIVGAAAVTSTLWIIEHPSVDGSTGGGDYANRWGRTMTQIPLWFLQNISAMPQRDTAAPLLVYALGLSGIGLLMSPLLAERTRRTLAAAAIVVLSLAFATWYTWSRLPTAGTLWQGRYMWCVAVAVLVLGGRALDRRPGRAIDPAIAWFGAAALTVCHAVVLVFVLRTEVRESPLSGSSQWHSPEVWTVALLSIAGTSMWLGSCVLAHRSGSGSASREGVAPGPGSDKTVVSA